MAVKAQNIAKTRKSDKKLNGISPIKPTKKPGERKRKIDTTKIKQLAAQGVIPTDIARQQGVALSTITRYLQSINMQVAESKQYSAMKVDALVNSQMKAAAVGDAILTDWLKNPEDLLKQDARLRKEILVAVQGVKTYDHNQERLERGQATSITDIRSLIMELDAAEVRALGMLSQAAPAPQDITQEV